MQDELAGEKEKQEVEFRRLLRARAERSKAKKGKLKQLADRIDRTQGVDALRELTREAVENLEAGVVSDITREVEREREQAMEKIEEDAKERLERARGEVGEH